MTPAQIDELFDEFVTEHGQGRNPDVRDYLDRAGSGRAELGALIDSYLAYAPIADTDEETVILVNARIAGRSPIAEARQARGLTLSAVVDDLRTRLGLAQGLTERLREAYEDLERDWLDPRGVHSSVWDALRSILRVDARRLVSGMDPGFAGALMRSARIDLDARAPTGSTPSLEPERDEVDRLFRGGVTEEK
jgi:hypothetical protein